MKKILYIWDKAYPWDVRAEKVCETLAEYGYEVHLLARWREGQPQTEIVRGVIVHRVAYKLNRILRFPFPKNPIWKKGIDSAIREIKPDIIIVREIKLGIPSGKSAKKHNVPIVMDMAENYPAAMRDWKEYNSNFINRFFVHTYKLPDKIESQCMKYMDGIITVCDEQIIRLNEQYNYPSEKCVVVHNTPIKNWLQAKEMPERKNLIFMHHGYLTAEKDVSMFLKGFLMACEERSDISFVLAGDGHCIENLKEIASQSEYGAKVDFLGEYSHKDLAKIIADSHIGVIPYQISDFNQYTIHNKIFDYFAIGRPVIVSENRPSIRMINESDAGWIVDCEKPESIKEAILNIASTDITSKTKAALKASKKYTWDNDFQTLVNFIERY